MNISFIIPVYNVEKYVSKAILSIIDNDWQDYIYEIVLVDDESPDNSVDVINALISQYPNHNIKLISQINKGLGGARNTGLLYAKGEYVFFLDSDDYLVNNIFPEFIKYMTINNLELLEFAALKVDENDTVLDKIFLNDSDGKILSGEEYISQISFTNSVCNKIYKRQLLIDYRINFIERVYIEDAPFNTEVFSKILRVVALNKVGVAYLQNPESITRTERSGKRLVKFINDSIVIIKRIRDLEEQYISKAGKEKVGDKAAFLTANTLWMLVFGRGIKVSDKKDMLINIRKAALFPYFHTTGSIPRDIFLFILNILGSLRIL